VSGKERGKGKEIRKGKTLRDGQYTLQKEAGGKGTQRAFIFFDTIHTIHRRRSIGLSFFPFRRLVSPAAQQLFQFLFGDVRMDSAARQLSDECCEVE
jgi:hypothetical protein